MRNPELPRDPDEDDFFLVGEWFLLGFVKQFDDKVKAYYYMASDRNLHHVGF